VHFIQAKKAWEDDPAKYRNGVLVSVENDGWITVRVDGKDLRFWNHDPVRARDCFNASGGQVGLPGWGLLHAPHGDGSRYGICISTDGPTPCVSPRPASGDPEDLIEQLRSYGGFMVPGRDVLRALDRKRNR
jgi:hypothetical protein